MALAVLPDADGFLLPSFGPKNNLLVNKNPQRKKQKSSSRSKQRRKRQQPEDAALKDSLVFSDLLTNANAVLTGVGAGIGAWTALSKPLQKKKHKAKKKLGSNAWQNMAASFALLAAGASAEATAIPLWMAASAAGILATQQNDDDMELEGAEATETEESFAWRDPPVETEQQKVQNEPIWVENELGLIQDQAAHLLDDVTVAVDRLYEQAAIASEEFTGGGGSSRFNGSSSYFGTGYAAGAAKPLYFSPPSSLGSDQPSPDAVSDFVTNLDAAVSSLQEYTPEPYLDGSAVLPRTSSIPQSGTLPFQPNQFSPTSNGWKENDSSATSPGGYMANYLDEINDGGAVMASPSYAASEPLPPNGQGAPEAPKMSTVPGQQAGRNTDGSYAPTQSRNVKGVASSVALAQAGSYLEQLQDAVAILPSFAATSPALDQQQQQQTPVEQQQQPAAPKMTTMPVRATYPGSFAPTKPQNVKGISSHSVSQAGGYLEQLKSAVSGLASFSTLEAATPAEDDGTTLAAPKMSTVPMGRQTFHRDSFAPTQPSVKNMDASSSMSSYLNDMGSAVAGLSSFVGTVEAAITAEPAPKMTTVPAKVSFAKGSFAPTKSNIKGLSSTTVAQAGGYLEQLQGAVAALSSYASAAPTGQAAATDDDVAPKMTTVPMGNQKFSQDSFAPTKASIKDNTVVPAAMFSNYLNHLQGAVSGLSTFVNHVSQEVTGAPIVEEVRAPKMTTVPAQQTFAQGSFAPTKPNIKDISSTTLSQASNYLDQLKGAAEAISSFVDAVQPSAGPDPTAATEDAAPKMTTVPMGKQVFRQDSFAPTQPSVKNLDSSSMTGYLSQLGSAVHGLSSFVDVVKQAVPEATSDAGPLAPKMTTVPMIGQEFPQESYAPTKRNVKGLSSVSVSQAGGYLEQLQNAVAGLSSAAGNLPPPDAADDTMMAPKMTTVPMGKQSFHRESFAPTRPSVKGVDSTAMASYLDTIGEAAMGLSSFVAAVGQSVAEDPPAPKMTTVPMGRQTFSQDSFAPTKPGVKGLSSVSVSQAGGYLDHLKDAIEVLSSLTDVKPDVLPPSTETDFVAPKMSTVPMGKQSFHRDSFAPTQPSVRNLDSHSMASYLDGLGHAVEGLSTFVEDVVQAVSSPDPPAPKMTTVPMGHQTFSQSSFAPTKSTIKGISSTSVSQAGFYLDHLKQAVEGITSATTTSPNVQSRDDRAAKAGAMASFVRDLRSTASKLNEYTADFDGLTAHLETLGSAVGGMEQFVDEVKRSLNDPDPIAATDQTTRQEAQIDTAQTPSMPFSSMPRASAFSNSFAPTKPNVKGLSGASIAQAGGYLDQLKGAIVELSSFSEVSPPVSGEEVFAQQDTVAAPKMTTVPMGNQSFGQSSFAPTKPSVKNMSSQSLSAYLDGLGDAVEGLSTFVEAVHEATPFTSMPKGTPFVPGSSFAPTKPTIKNISSTSVSQAGGYLEQLRNAVNNLHSVAEEFPVETHAQGSSPSDVAAPKMTTVPMGKATFKQASFAPTKSNVKNMPSQTLSVYLDSLNHAVQGLSSFVEEVSEALPEHEFSTEMSTSVPFSSMPKAGSFAKGAFSPTKPSIKGSSSSTVAQAGGYLDHLHDTEAGISSFAEQSQLHPPTDDFQMAPKMSTVPMGKQAFKQASFAPTRTNIKGTSSHTVTQDGGYLDHLHDTQPDISSFPVDSQLRSPATEDVVVAPKMTTVPMGRQNFPQSSFAPTKSNIKGTSSNTVTQDGGYLDHLHDKEAGISSFAEPNLVNAPAPATEDSLVAPKMTTVPMGKQTFHQSSFAPTNPGIKDMPLSVSLPSYLNGLDNAVAGLSSFIASVDRAVAFSSMPKPGTYAPGSYAPTKPGVKTVESSSVAQAGGYLDKLRSVVHELSSFAAVNEEVPSPQDTNPDNYPAAPKMTTVPMGKANFKEGSFAPTKSSVKNVVPVSLPSYLDDLQDAVSGLSSFMNEVAETVSVTADISPPRMTTMPAKVTTFQKGAFAPTKGSVKDLSGRSSGMQGNYLDALKDGLDSLRSQISQVSPVEPASQPPAEPAPKMSTVPAKQTNLPPGGYAPTKPSIKSAPVAQAGGYLDNLKNAVSGLSSFVDAVSNAPIPAEAPVVAQLKASADRLAPFSAAETPASPTAPEPVQIPAAATGVTQPALDSAVSTLNQKLSSLSIVVSELSTANDARNQHLEAKVDDLTETVRTLNQSVANLASCIQSLNDGFTGLMAVAETLQQQQQPVTRAAP